LKRMKERGIRHVFYMQVDNPLVSVCDPVFLGYHLLAGSEISTQVVTKESPLEPLGNVVSIDGKLRILEYSDLSRVAEKQPEIAQRRQPDGTSIFWAGNLGVHVMEVAFLQRVAEQDQGSGVRSQESGAGSQESGVRSQRPGATVSDSCSLSPASCLSFHIAKKKVPFLDARTGQL